MGPEEDKGRILVSPYPPVRLPDGGLYKFIHGKLLQFAPRTALIDSTTGSQLTNQDVLQLVERVAYHYLQRHGVTRGDVFALCASNSMTYIILLLALARLGVVFAPINILSTPDDLKRSLSVVEAKFLFTTQTMADQIHGKMESAPLKMIFMEGTRSVTQLFEPVPAGHTAPPIASMHSDDVCGLLFSSGTSGVPKAVESTQRGYLAQGLISGTAGFGVTAGILFPSLAHTLGIMLLLSSLASGVFLVVMPRFDAERYLRLVEKYKIRQLNLVPPILVLLAKSALVDKYDLSSVEEIIAGSAPISADLEQQVMTRLGSHLKQIRQLYGMTETNTPVTALPAHSKQIHPAPPGSVGTVLVNIQLKVVDVTSSEVLSANQKGEIRIKSDFNMIRYKGNAAATSEAFDEDGWLRTGDVGYYDEQGYVFVVDRIKELIKYNAYQVAPAELEGVLLTHSSVADAGVIGIPDPQAGELPHAWVVPTPGSGVTEDDIIKFVADRVAPYKKLRGGVRFVAEVPKSTSGKIQHIVMRAEMRKLKSNM